MAKNTKFSNGVSGASLIEVKSKFDAEFRRFSVDRNGVATSDQFYDLVNSLHHLNDIPFLITYTDTYGDQLPINNNDNYMKALDAVKGVLRLQIQRKGETPECGFGTIQRKKKTPITKFISQNDKTPPRKPHVAISFPEDFRRVSAIIDVDIVPETHRRVRLMKNGSEKPLGFYIRDGVSVRVTPHGLEKVPGIFISRLVQGGLAESTGLLAVNDEVLEVNGIEVTGKSLDQVTDMMVANSSNLIITVKPVNQTNTLASTSARHHPHRRSGVSVGSNQSAVSIDSDEVKDLMYKDEDDDDEIKDHNITGGTPNESDGGMSERKASRTSDDNSDVVTL